MNKRYTLTIGGMENNVSAVHQSNSLEYLRRCYRKHFFKVKKRTDEYLGYFIQMSDNETCRILTPKEWYKKAL